LQLIPSQIVFSKPAIIRDGFNLMQKPRKNTRGELAPFVIAVVVAVVGTAALFFLEFGTKDKVAGNGISMVTSAAADRAGATALPTADYNAADQNRPSFFRIMR
jgi:hypothetical protein